MCVSPQRGHDSPAQQQCTSDSQAVTWTCRERKEDEGERRGGDKMLPPCHCDRQRRSRLDTHVDMCNTTYTQFTPSKVHTHAHTLNTHNLLTCTIHHKRCETVLLWLHREKHTHKLGSHTRKHTPTCTNTHLYIKRLKVSYQYQ